MKLLIIIFILTNILYSNLTIVEDDRIYTEGVYYTDESTNESPFSNSVRTKYRLPNTRNFFNSHLVNDTFISDSVSKNQILTDENGFNFLLLQKNNSIYYYKYDSILNPFILHKKILNNSAVLEIGHSELLDSNLVVVWRENTNTWDSVIKSQIISFSGDTIGPMITVSGDFSNAERFNPSINFINNDLLLFIWSGQEQEGNSIWGQFTDHNLNKIGDYFSIIENNLLGNGHSFYLPTISISDENNNYLISWTDDRSGINKVYGKFVNIDSSITNSSFLIGNEYYSCCSSNSYDENGDIYISYYQRINDFDGNVVVKKINSDGIELTDHLVINNVTQSTNFSSIKKYNEEEFLIIWEDNETNSNITELKGQKISTSLMKIDDEFKISSRSNNLDQINSDFNLFNNNIISTWNEYVNGYEDTAWINIINYNNPPLENEFDLLPIKNSVLLKSFPNPSNSTLQFSIQSYKNINNSIINIYSIKGEKVSQISMINIKKGINYFRWNGKNDNNVKLSSGIYLFELVYNNRRLGSNKFLLLK